MEKEAIINSIIKYINNVSRETYKGDWTKAAANVVYDTAIVWGRETHKAGIKKGFLAGLGLSTAVVALVVTAVARKKKKSDKK